MGRLAPAGIQSRVSKSRSIRRSGLTIVEPHEAEYLPVPGFKVGLVDHGLGTARG